MKTKKSKKCEDCLIPCCEKCDNTIKTVDGKLRFHPGYYVNEIIEQEEKKLIEPMLESLAHSIGITVPELNALRRGQLDVDYGLACGLAASFDTGEVFWLNLQKNYDK